VSSRSLRAFQRWVPICWCSRRTRL
jgi:hypothetical protein